jgi:hypothetical protein
MSDCLSCQKHLVVPRREIWIDSEHLGQYVFGLAVVAGPGVGGGEAGEHINMPNNLRKIPKAARNCVGLR